MPPSTTSDVEDSVCVDPPSQVAFWLRARNIPYVELGASNTRIEFNAPAAGLMCHIRMSIQMACPGLYIGTDGFAETAMIAGHCTVYPPELGYWLNVVRHASAQALYAHIEFVQEELADASTWSLVARAPTKCSPASMMKADGKSDAEIQAYADDFLGYDTYQHLAASASAGSRSPPPPTSRPAFTVTEPDDDDDDDDDTESEHARKCIMRDPRTRSAVDRLRRGDMSALADLMAIMHPFL